MAKITKKSLYEGFAKAGYAYVVAFDMAEEKLVDFTYLTSIYDPGEILGFAELAEDKRSVRVGSVQSGMNQIWGARKNTGVERYSADAVVVEFQKMRQMVVSYELPQGEGRLTSKVKEKKK